MKGYIKNRGNFGSILTILPAAIIILFAFAIILPMASESAQAEGDEPEEGISITISDPVSANLVLFDEGDYKIAKDTVHVSSSAPYGYELYLSTDSEEHQSIYLNNDPTSTSVISPVSGTIAEPAVLTNNTWGFAIAGQGNFDNEYSTTSPDPNSHFAIIPTTNDQAVYENNSATADDDIDFYYGIKIESTLEPGEYTTSASYTAIIKTLPPLTAKAILGENGNLNFLYDSEIYTPGDTYGDNLAEIGISAVYNVPTNSSSDNMPEWVSNENIVSANFDQSFYDFKPTSTSYWFYNNTYLGSITQATNLDTSRVTNMSSMFEGAGNEAATFDLDLSGWSTSNVTTMASMFHAAGTYADDWSIGNISGWNTSNVTDMSNMFYGASQCTSDFDLDLRGWNTSKVTNMASMFRAAGYYVGAFNLDISGSGWNTSNVTDMSYMFDQAGRYASIWSIGDLSGWKTNSVTDMSYMFWHAGGEAEVWNIGDLSGWNTGNVTTMRNMFEGAGRNATTWDIGNLNYVDEDHKGWDVRKVTNHYGFVSWSQSNINIYKLPWQSNY